MSALTGEVKSMASTKPFLFTCFDILNYYTLTETRNVSKIRQNISTTVDFNKRNMLYR